MTGEGIAGLPINAQGHNREEMGEIPAVPLHAMIDFPNIDGKDQDLLFPCPTLSADDLRQADECFDTPKMIDRLIAC